MDYQKSTIVAVPLSFSFVVAKRVANNFSKLKKDSKLWQKFISYQKTMVAIVVFHFPFPSEDLATEVALAVSAVMV